MSTEPICIRLDARVYDLDVAQRAAFRCTDIAFFDFEIMSPTEIAVTVNVKSGLVMEAEALRARYQTELLDQRLRRTIAEETQTERDLILAFAFSNTKYVEP